MLKSAARLAFGLVLFAALASVQPQAEAACIHPRSITTAYFAYVNNGSNTFYSCTYVVLNPPIEYYTHWAQIGERTTDCDRNESSWGDTTTCTGSSNTTFTSTACSNLYCQ